MNELIKGGIYTINDECFVFIDTHGRSGRLACLSVGPNIQCNEEALFEVNFLFFKNSLSTLRERFIILDTSYFYENCDGYLGKIDDWFYNALKTSWKEPQ